MGSFQRIFTEMGREKTSASNFSRKEVRSSRERVEQVGGEPTGTKSSLKKEFNHRIIFWRRDL
jgi:hypothetical protein